MSDTRPANFSSVWADLRGVSFKQHYIDAGRIRTRCIESGDPSKPLVLALHGVGGVFQKLRTACRSSGVTTAEKSVTVDGRQLVGISARPATMLSAD
jgi:hypothetical protein